MKRQLLFAYGLSALISATALAGDASPAATAAGAAASAAAQAAAAGAALSAKAAEADLKEKAALAEARAEKLKTIPILERVKPLANPEVACANHEKIIASCQKEDARLRKLASKTKFKMLDKDYEPTLKVAEDAYLLFGGCGLYYSEQIKAGKIITKDVEALLEAEKKCINLTYDNFGMHVDTLGKKMAEDRYDLRNQFYKLLDVGGQLLDASSVSLKDVNKTESKAANKGGDKAEKDKNEIAKDIVKHDPSLQRRIDDIRQNIGTSDGKHKKNSKLPGAGMSMGDMLKTALGLGALGGGLGMGIADLMNMPNLSAALPPLVNPAAAPSAAAGTDSGAAAGAGGGGIGSTNPTVADSSMVRLTAAVTEYADGRRLVNGKEVGGRLQSKDSDDPARPDNSGRSGGGSTSKSTTLNSNSQGLVSSDARSIARPLSTTKDSSRRERYADEQNSGDDDSGDRKNHRDNYRDK